MLGHDMHACAGFDSQPWYAALFDFELGSSAGAGNGSAGGDSDLVPQLVTQVLILLGGLRVQPTKAAPACVQQ